MFLRLKFWLAAVLLSILLTLALLPTLPTIFLPKRWLVVHEGESMETVYKVLGVPDINFGDKNFAGWHNPFYLGASVLIVRYDNSQRVSQVKIETKWGSEYKKWAQDYKQFLK